MFFLMIYYIIIIIYTANTFDNRRLITKEVTFHASELFIKHYYYIARFIIFI